MSEPKICKECGEPEYDSERESRWNHWKWIYNCAEILHYEGNIEAATKENIIHHLEGIKPDSL